MKTYPSNHLSRRAASGQTLVEFSLTLMLMATIVMMVLDMGRAVYYYSALHNSAREGARYGSVNPGDTAGIIQASHGMTVGLNPDDIDVTVVETSDGKIVVSVDYDFQAATPLLATITGSDTISLHSEARMHIEVEQ